jgi:alanine racemase
MRPTQVLIDLSALRHNLVQVRKAAPGCKVMAAVKADAYGHGLVRAAQALADADGFGVAAIEEALQMRQAGIEAPITLLEGFFHVDEFPLIEQHSIDLVLHQPWQVEALEQAKFSQPVCVWLKLDTGMHRLGFAPQQAAEWWQRLQANPSLTPLGQMTHLACADDLEGDQTRQQLAQFAEVTCDLDGEKSIANSAGILGWPDSRGDVVRPGIMLYGVSPFIGGRAAKHNLRPVMTFSSELIAIEQHDKGEAIGYGATWCCPEKMSVGVIACGYGDGYPRHAPSGTPVLVNNRIVPLIGRVSMDMITVDLRSQPDAQVGDQVVLWGEGLPAEEVAEQAGTIAYELFCSVTSRVRCLERS